MRRFVLPAAVLFVFGLTSIGCGRSNSGGAKGNAAAPKHVPIPQPTATVIYLRRPATQPIGKAACPLIREVARQAILIAARDGLGVETHDAVLGEPEPAPTRRNEAAANLDVERGASEVSPLVHFNSRGVTMDEVVWPQGQTGNHFYILLEEAERRSRGPYVDLLHRSGFVGAANKMSPTAKTPEAIDALLNEMNVFSQFQAVRLAHAAIRHDGESPQRLAALVRGYANLGQLTRFEWTAAHDVFEARSLLYAQRMVAAQPQSPLALHCRAYAEAMVGLHGLSLRDQRAAEKLAGGADSRPAWAGLLKPLCYYDTPALLNLGKKDSSLQPLASYLAYLTLEHSGSTAAVIETGKAALTYSPECFRLIDSMCDVAGVSYLHMLTEMGPSAMVQALRTELPRIKDPPEVKDAWTKAHTNPDLITDVADVARAMVNAQEPSEPSWSVLGRRIEETNFVQVERRAQFMAKSWGVDAGDFVGSAMPMVKDHPYRSLIESYALGLSSDPEIRKRLLRNLDLQDPQWQMQAAVLATWDVNTPGKMQGKLAWRTTFAEMDATAWSMEVELLTPYADPVNKAEYIHRAAALKDASPHCPIAAAALIRWDGDHVAQKFDQWQKEFPSHPAVTGALGRWYSEHGQPEKAEPFLEEYIKSAPDAWAYTMLSDDYLRQGREEDWLKTLRASLDQEDYGLDHAAAEARIANHYMSKGRFAEAKPYADAAAESWASWAMECAAQCEEGLKNWDDAATWVQRNAERYDRPMDWYKWCQCTGKGDLGAARAAAAAHMASLQGRDDLQAWTDKIAFYGAEGKNDRMADAARHVLDSTNNPWAALNLANFYDESGDTAQRDMALKAAVERGPKFKGDGAGFPRMVSLADMMRKSLAGGAALSADAVKKLLPEQGPERDGLEYFSGRFLEDHGQKEQGREMLIDCVHNGSGATTSYLLTCVHLRSEGVEPRDYLPTPRVPDPISP